MIPVHSVYLWLVNYDLIQYIENPIQSLSKGTYTQIYVLKLVLKSRRDNINIQMTITKCTIHNSLDSVTCTRCGLKSNTQVREREFVVSINFVSFLLNKGGCKRFWIGDWTWIDI
jgi:hypothetical protein